MESGDCYEGKWVNDKQEDDNATYTYKSGAKYVGKFSDGKKTGPGTHTYTNKAKYVGEWNEDK